ncbi:ATP-binding cassette domain-containing protein [Microbacterium sp. 20-116]|uniref:ATP-binding cassette domain-containing protein n=1 Tax=Microbacterium sp. 20-116 TaxID=3239883 RepID=UPI0034E20397
MNYAYPGSPREIIRDFDQTLRPGTTMGLVGPSGSGKSTLLDLIGGLRKPVSGSVAFDNVPASEAVRRAATAWVAQTNPMLHGRTAVENAAIALLAQGADMMTARAAACRSLADLGLEDRMLAPMARLSGGEQQRVSIVRCLLSDRPLVLADEPTGQLDHQNTAAVVDAFKTLARAGKIVIIATHDPSVWERLDEMVDLRESP